MFFLMGFRGIGDVSTCGVSGILLVILRLLRSLLVRQMGRITGWAITGAWKWRLVSGVGILSLWLLRLRRIALKLRVRAIGTLVGSPVVTWVAGASNYTRCSLVWHGTNIWAIGASEGSWVGRFVLVLINAGCRLDCFLSVIWGDKFACVSGVSFE
jgi:hypothetical protein